MSCKSMRWLAVALLIVSFGAAAQTNNFNTLDKGGIQVLCKSAVAVSAPNDTSEDTLATCTVPANAMGANGSIRVNSSWSFTNSGNNKTLRFRYSGISGTSHGVVMTTQGTANMQLKISNRNATASQHGEFVGLNGSSTFSEAQTTPTADTTASTSLVFTCQKATGSETCTLESFLVELMPSN